MDKVLKVDMHVKESNDKIKMSVKELNDKIKMSLSDPFYKVVEKDYEKLINLPSINGVTLIGNRTIEDFGIVITSVLEWQEF